MPFLSKFVSIQVVLMYTRALLSALRFRRALMDLAMALASSRDPGHRDEAQKVVPFAFRFQWPLPRLSAPPTGTLAADPADHATTLAREKEIVNNPPSHSHSKRNINQTGDQTILSRSI